MLFKLISYLVLEYIRFIYSFTCVDVRNKQDVLLDSNIDNKTPRCCNMESFQTKEQYLLPYHKTSPRQKKKILKHFIVFT